MGITITLYSHDSLGLGHARRNRALAYALAEGLPRLTGEEVGGLLIAGHRDAATDSLPAGWDWLVLPGFARTPSGYTARHVSLSSRRLTALRSAALTATLDAVAPDLFIADRHPFGVDGELRQALVSLRRGGRCATVLGLRDVLDSPAVASREWEAIGGAPAVAGAYDQIWVYGDASVYDPVRSGEVPAGLAHRCVHTGYLSRGRPADLGSSPERPFVLTLVGGGADGGALALTAAASVAPPGHRHVIVTGPQMPREHVARVRSIAGPEVTVLRTARNVPELIAQASAVVCMAGYNSLSEVLATATPALVVPRAQGRAEQPRRTEALAAVGAVDRVEGPCTSVTVSQWFASVAGRRVDRRHVDRDGLSRVSELAAGLLDPARRAPAKVVADVS